MTKSLFPIMSNIPLGQLILKYCPNADVDRVVRVEVNVDQNKLLRLSVLDLVTKAYLNLGLVDFSKITPPPIQHSDNSENFDLGGLINELVEDIATRTKRGEPPSRFAGGTPRRGDDILQKVELSFENGLSGTQKHMDVLHDEK